MSVILVELLIAIYFLAGIIISHLVEVGASWAGHLRVTIAWPWLGLNFLWEYYVGD